MKENRFNLRKGNDPLNRLKIENIMQVNNTIIHYLKLIN